MFRRFVILLVLLNATITLASDGSVYLEQQVLNGTGDLSSVVTDYYKSTGYVYLWSKENTLLPNAYGLYALLQAAESKGLHPDDYLLHDIQMRWNDTDQSARAELDILLTRAYEKYVKHLGNGRWKAREVDEDWHIHPTEHDIRGLLSELVSNPIETIISKLEPMHSGYQALIRQLNLYTAIAVQGGWPVIADGPVLRKNIRHPQVQVIRKRLRITKDLVLGPLDDADRVDTAFMDAVMNFQARHGLAIDGIVGVQTRAAMNVPVEQRVRRIKVNIDRWRWLPHKLGERYLLINLTGFELYAEEQGKAVLSMPIIIGKRYRATPSFSSYISHLEINPYWTIPKSIALKDLIPVQLRDKDYFHRKKIRVFNGWKKDAEELDIDTIPLRKLNDNYFPYRFRQDAGPENSLGRIKFMFPNPYDIYLHDTPNRYLFDRRIRTFSSGCIRVADPLRLSAYLLNAPTQQKEEEVLQLIYRGEHRGMSLVRAVPIYLLYWTAWTDRDGKLNFRDDIYGRDEKMLNHLKKMGVKPDKM